MIAALARFSPAQLLQEVSLRQRLLLVAGVLAAIGLIMVASASMGVAARANGDAFYYFIRHLSYLTLAFVVASVAMRLPVSLWQRFSTTILLLAFALLLLVLVPGVGHRVNGSTRWLALAGFTLQPSEFAKFAVVTYMGAYLLRRQDEVRSSWSGFLKPMLVVGVAVFLLLLEPDFGASVVTVAAVVGLLFLAGTPLRQFIVLISTVAVMAVLAVVLEPYRMKRLLAFTDPWADQFNSGYQLAQSLIAFGRGEWFGVGLGHSVQKLFYLPEAHTDFVFAVYAEEFGLMGVLFVIFLFWFLVHTIIRIGQQAELCNKAYAAYLAYGFAFLIGVQALVNIGVNMGLVPTKGLTLPLVSYGGSSLLAVFLMLGVLLRIDAENQAPATASRMQGGRA